MSADRYAWLHTVPALALANALKKAGLDADDLELVEINEAFASVAINSTRMLRLDEDRVNVNGGGGPRGGRLPAGGGRIVLTPARQVSPHRAAGAAADYC